MTILLLMWIKISPHDKQFCTKIACHVEQYCHDKLQYCHDKLVDICTVLASLYRDKFGVLHFVAFCCILLHFCCILLHCTSIMQLIIMHCSELQNPKPAMAMSGFSGCCYNLKFKLSNEQNLFSLPELYHRHK